jgi:integrase
MARVTNVLTAVAVKQWPAGKWCDGGGLWLVKSDRETGKWVFRYTAHGRRREMGLGSITDVSLRAAREASDGARAVVRSGLDPITQREKQKREAARNLHLLADVASDAFEARKAELKGDGVAGRWMSPIAVHILPRLGKMPVSEIDQIAIRDALSPIFHTKGQTATKALNRLSLILKHAAALGLDVDLQAVDKAKALLGRSRSATSHIKALPYKDVPAFYASLRDGTVTHLAMRLLILTGVRSGPLRHIREDQIAGDDVWTIPADAMKGRRDATQEFRVPLSGEALEVIDQARRHARDGSLFPSTRQGVVSDMTLGMYMRRAGLDARPHGFRSSLRNWLAEATDAPHEVAETILGHVAGSKVVKAYRRTDFLEQRRVLMERWASHCTGKSGQVVELVRAV